MSKNCPKAHLHELNVTIQALREIEDYSPCLTDDMISDPRASITVYFMETAETYTRAREERR